MDRTVASPVQQPVPIRAILWPAIRKSLPAIARAARRADKRARPSIIEGLLWGVSVFWWYREVAERVPSGRPGQPGGSRPGGYGGSRPGPGGLWCPSCAASMPPAEGSRSSSRRSPAKRRVLLQTGRELELESRFSTRKRRASLPQSRNPLISRKTSVFQTCEENESETC